MQAKQTEQETAISNLKNQFQQKEQEYETIIANLKTQVQQQHEELKTQNQTVETLRVDVIANLQQTIQNLLQQTQETEIQGIQDRADMVVAECAEQIAHMSDIINDHKTEWFAAIDEKKADLEELFEEIQDFKEQDI